MNPALETLMLVFANETEDMLPIPPRALFLGALPDPALKEWPEITGWQPHKGLADAWKRAGFPHAQALPHEKWPVVLVLPSKSRDETLGWFATARQHLEPGGNLVVAMPNAAGAKRFEKELVKATGNLRSLQKHKCRAFHATDDGSWNEALFQEWLILGAPKPIPDTTFVAQAGTFSHAHIDPGSRFLVEHLPTHLKGAAADLGAGWGYLSDALLQKCPKIQSLDLFEVDDRAISSAKQNLQHHKTPIHYHWHDVTEGLADHYDTIVMNPPFHSGQLTDFTLGRTFLQVASAALKPRGELLLVANRQLPYEAELDACPLSWQLVAENPTYKLLFAQRP